MKYTKKICLAGFAALALGLATYNELKADIVVVCDPGDTCCSVGNKKIEGKLREIIIIE